MPDILYHSNPAFVVRCLDGQESHWRGRVCKVYSKVGGEWKMTMHTGVLDYS